MLLQTIGEAFGFLILLTIMFVICLITGIIIDEIHNKQIIRKFIKWFKNRLKSIILSVVKKYYIKTQSTKYLINKEVK